MKKWLSIVACLAFSAAYAGENNADVMKQIELLQKQIAQQQSMIDALRNQMNEQQDMVQTEVASAIEAGLADAKAAPAISLGSGIDGLKITGDLRLRYELTERDDDSPSDWPNANPGANNTQTTDDSRSRFLSRVRIGGIWTNSEEDWEIGIGLATTADGVGEAGANNTTSDTWGAANAFERGGIALDYAYAKHTWQDYGLSLTVGQMKNPFKTTWILWDSDIRPTGAVVNWDQELFFVTAGAFNVYGDRWLDDGTDGTTADMYAGQIGAKLCLSEGIEALLAVGYYAYDMEVSEVNGVNGFAGGDTDGNGKEDLHDLDYVWEIGDIYGELTAKVSDVDLKLYGQYCQNFGAESSNQLAPNRQWWNPTGVNAVNGNLTNPNRPDYEAEDNDTAWIAGIEGEFMNFTLGYAYAYIEGDAVPAFTADSDFGNWQNTGLNVKGHKISLAYDITKNFSAGVTGMFVEAVEATDDPGTAAGLNSLDDEVALYQFDLKYKF